MPEYNIQLRGWHAILAIAALLAFLGISMALRVRPVDDEMRAAVRERLLDEYSGRGPKDIARIVEEARDGTAIENIPEVVQRDIQFPSMGHTAGWAEVSSTSGRRLLLTVPLLQTGVRFAISAFPANLVAAGQWLAKAIPTTTTANCARDSCSFPGHFFPHF